MERICETCAASYDDAICSTICPHRPWLTETDQQRKDRAVALLGKDLHWAHLPDGPTVRITSIAWNGMVTLHGWTGEFAPHLFTVIEEVR